MGTGMSEKKIVVTLIRHGETAGNKEKRYIGTTDESLSDEGIRQICELKEILSKTNDNILVFASPMTRCQETAKLLFPENKIHIIDGFREMDFGDFEGKNYVELSGNKDYQAWIDSGGRLPFPNGESRELFIKRSVCAFDKMLEIIANETVTSRKSTATNDDVINAFAVVHGGTIMSILSKLAGGDYYDYQVKNGEGYKLTFCEGELNDISRNCFSGGLHSGCDSGGSL